MAAWNEASVRSDGLKNSRPRIFPASACGSGWLLQAFGERQQLDDLLARQVRQVEEVVHAELQIDQRGAQPVDVFLFEYEGGQQAQDRRIACGAGEDVPGQQRLLHILGGFVELAARAEIPGPGSRSTGPTLQVSRRYADTRRTLASRSSCLDGVEVASATAQAIGPPPNVVPRFSSLSRRGDRRRQQQRRHRESRCPAPWRS